MNVNIYEEPGPKPQRYQEQILLKSWLEKNNYKKNQNTSRGGGADL